MNGFLEMNKSGMKLFVVRPLLVFDRSVCSISVDDDIDSVRQAGSYKEPGDEFCGYGREDVFNPTEVVEDEDNKLLDPRRSRSGGLRGFAASFVQLARAATSSKAYGCLRHL